MAPWILTYTRPLLPPAAISLVLSPELGGFLRVTGPWHADDLPERSEIGKYKCAVNAAEVTQLKKLVVAAVEETRSKTTPAALPGTPFLEFGVRETDGSEQSASFAMTKQLSPNVKRLDDSMTPVIKKLLGSPYATLKGEASCSEHALGRKPKPELFLTLINTGKIPVMIRHPAIGDKDDHAGVEIVIEKDKPAEQLKDSDRIVIQTKRKDITELKARRAESGASSAKVELHPHDALVLGVKIRQQLYLGSGTYRAYVRFFSDVGGISEESAVEGNMLVPAGKFSVK